ncbi:hypothetical protein AVEN_34434-1 [Araneus ventricosus]|uniref:Uncharacterized protein n=1 Tax=Araneus ventricosus TaxID=182803 RepID=A0A4Y2GZ30_ARAVE|nr:hypothetical protein AVEN_34434-1 [Araneus ventricosus]
MTWSTPEQAPPSPNFHTTPTGGCLTHDVRFNVHREHIHGGPSMESGLERVITLRFDVRPATYKFFDLSPPRPESLDYATGLDCPSLKHLFLNKFH